jgi:hypothetical protein
MNAIQERQRQDRSALEVELKPAGVEAGEEVTPKTDAQAILAS